MRNCKISFNSVNLHNSNKPLLYVTISPMLSELTIVITSYKTPQILLKSLSLLDKYANGASLIVVDSDSQDETVALVKEYYPQVKVVEVANHSMGNAANAGIRLAKTAYVMQMNADVYISKHTIPDLLEILKQKNVAMVAPRAKNPEGKWQNQGLAYKRFQLLLDFNKKQSVKAGWLHGCCLMMKSELAEIAMFDTEYRFYNEDIDLSYRLIKAGYECHLVNTEVLHLGGSSTPNSANFIVEGYRGGYIISQKYKSKFYRWLHRQFVLLEANTRLLKAHGEKKKAYSAIKKMFLAQDFSESPFGETLNDDNPFFKYFK